MQAIMEPIFHVVYLTTVISLGIIMIRKSKDNQYTGALNLKTRY